MDGLMRSRIWSLVMIAGIIGLALTLTNYFTPLGQSILLGASIGLILVGPVGELTIAASKLGRPRTAPVPRLSNVAEGGKGKSGAEDQRMHGRIDGLISRMNATGNTRTPERVGRGFGGAVDRLARGDAVWGAGSPGVLPPVNRGDGMYTKEMVADAIHLWSDERFNRLLSDSRGIGLMSASARQEVEEMVEKEVAKAKRAGDVSSMRRSDDIMRAILHSKGAAQTVKVRKASPKA